MSPIRIIIIAILVYIGYRLIVGGRRKKTASRPADRESGTLEQDDILEEDPVCKKLVPRQQAVQFEHNGTIHYFCSKKCCKIYRKNQGE
ncbi:YHS domain-containing protein [Desulforhopalus sp. IMCC35007]|uniref:YHS domain-containing protein n=1 Tax=Desulforhopalus sp. IMCC35007 TaxID=2569543 RepID=UPI0010AE228A|nr:YHS domain-containing protein [Desulforhopalus sp. IMCC35007]TKB11794.1 YHS domain-containing protein [Desulforhopalus sp. IMCC35007]